MTTIWVYAPVIGTEPHPAALELLTKARSIGDDIAAVTVGEHAADAAGPLGEHGAARVYAAVDRVYDDHPGGPAAAVLASLIGEHAPDLVLFPATYDARDVAGRLQARTGSTLMANATDILGADRAVTEILGGTKIVEVALEGPTPRLVLVRPRSFAAEPSGGTAEVIPVSVDVPAEALGARIVERHEEQTAGPKLEEAKVVIAGGRGLGGPEPFAMLDELAGAIGGAAVGASRAAVDAGWVPYAYQIGQTGKTVKPEVYLAVGVSGALQHVVGMKGAKRVIAINKDDEAPILRLADLGVIGDLFDIVPKLTEEVRRRRS
jgi:electron transfer flavoprotein alpha subunit